MIDFTDSDFKNCKYKIFNLQPHVFEAYPELKVMYAEIAAICYDIDWREWIKPEELIKYVVYCYHKPSPLITKIPELRERKITALQMAGIDLAAIQNIVAAKPVVANILLSRHEFTSRLALHFLKHENNLLWSEYCKVLDYLEDSEYEMTNPNANEEGKKLNSVEIAEKKGKVYKGLQQYRSDLNALADRLMQGDLELQNFMQGQLVMAKRLKLITPEDFVRLTADELTEAFRQRGVIAQS